MLRSLYGRVAPGAIVNYVETNAADNAPLTITVVLAGNNQDAR
jgi:hypothetical protein